jgi:superfamily I DNA/RNA helicase
VPIAQLPEWAHRRAGAAARAAAERLLALLDEIHAASRSSRPVEALQFVLERTTYLDWFATTERGRGHVEHVQALRAILAGSEAPDLATWLADLHLDDAETGASDDRGSRLCRRRSRPRSPPG